MGRGVVATLLPSFEASIPGSDWHHSQMSRILRHIPPIVVEAITQSNRLAHQLLDRKVIKCSNPDTKICATHRIDMTMAMRGGATLAAEPVMILEPFPRARIITKSFFAAQQREVCWVNLRVPVALFPAESAIAFAATLEVHTDFKLHQSTVTAAMVCFQHLITSTFPPSDGRACGMDRP